ncbi:hypothetical protein G7046_g4910 [Stylonectria norvegica]|nr:hypothetical protein G7046_g4910 [Stylonectria norvegica]
MKSSILKLLAICLLLSLLISHGMRANTAPAENTVSTTSIFVLVGGALVNTGCALVVRQMRAVEPGDEMGACSPYGLAGAGITARLHMFWVDGYGPVEWAAVRSMPERTAGGVWRMGEEVMEWGMEMMGGLKVVRDGGDGEL